MVVLDTSILIDHLRRSKKEESHFEQIAKIYPKEAISISLMTIQELYRGKSTRHEEQKRYLLALVGALKILPYTYDIAKLAGEIERDLVEPIELADAAIAATAIIHGYQLATLNSKDFKGIKELELVEL